EPRRSGRRLRALPSARPVLVAVRARHHRVRLRARRFLGACDVDGIGRGGEDGPRLRVRLRADQSRLGSRASRRSRRRRRARPTDLGHRAVSHARGAVHAYACGAVEIEKLLVANRGEIALRVFRACRALGIATVAVVAPDDKGSLHGREADETVEIASYLFSEEHIRAAKQTGADAIHPGYGFLAENPDFAEAVDAAGLVFVGPSPDALRAGGDKLEA